MIQISLLCIAVFFFLMDSAKSQFTISNGVLTQTICQKRTFFAAMDNCVFVNPPGFYKCPSTGEFPYADFRTSITPIGNTTEKGDFFHGSWNYGNLEMLELYLRDPGSFAFKFRKILITIDGADVFIDDGFLNTAECLNLLPEHTGSGNTTLRVTQKLGTHNEIELYIYINDTVCNPSQEFTSFTSDYVFAMVSSGSTLFKVAVSNFTTYDPENMQTVLNMTADEIFCHVYYTGVVTTVSPGAFAIVIGIVLGVVGIIAIILILVCCCLLLTYVPKPKKTKTNGRANGKGKGNGNYREFHDEIELKNRVIGDGIH